MDQNQSSVKARLVRSSLTGTRITDDEHVVFSHFELIELTKEFRRNAIALKQKLSVQFGKRHIQHVRSSQLIVRFTVRLQVEMLSGSLNDAFVGGADGRFVRITKPSPNGSTLFGEQKASDHILIQEFDRDLFKWKPHFNRKTVCPVSPAIRTLIVVSTDFGQNPKFGHFAKKETGRETKRN
jgi:hypothetical protein